MRSTRTPTSRALLATALIALGFAPARARQQVPSAPAAGLSGGQLAAGTTDSLTTRFDGGKVATGFSLDLVPSVNLRLRTLEVNLASPLGTPTAIAVLYREGSSLGNEEYSPGWIQLDRGPVVSKGPGNPATLSLPNADLIFKEGRRYSLLVVDTDPSPSLTGSLGGQAEFENEDLRLETNALHTLPLFGMGHFSAGYAWNGTLYYDTLPNLNVAIVAAASSSTSACQFTDVRSTLEASGKFNSVEVFNAAPATPTLAELRRYDAVLTWSNSQFADPNALGDVLADYVDGGGGVVVAPFANTSGGNQRLGGRWLAQGYEVIVGAGGSASGTATLGTLDLPDHPVLQGVTSFQGGIRPTGTTLTAGSRRIASWSDGRVLVAEGRPGRIDLGFYPPSSNCNPSWWLVGTDGDRLLANALCEAAAPRPRVLIAGAVSSGIPDSQIDAQAKLEATRRFNRIDLFDTAAGTPSLSLLQQYDALLSWANAVPQDRVALGDVMADYLDGGGGVVTQNYAQRITHGLQGRWSSGGYHVVQPTGTRSSPFESLGTVHEPEHAVMWGVVRFDGGGLSLRPSLTVLQSGARSIAEWSDGLVLAAEGRSPKQVALTFFLPSADVYASGWLPATDGDELMANALEFVSRGPVVPRLFAYCTAGTTSDGCRATIGASGVPSVANSSGFTLEVTGMPGNKPGILFYGISGPNAAPWGNSTSFLCVAPPTQRTGLLPRSGTVGACDGALSLDWLGWVSAHPGKLGTPFDVGCGVWVQGWFRDPAAGTGPVGAKGTATSDALHFVTTP